MPKATVKTISLPLQSKSKTQQVSLNNSQMVMSKNTLFMQMQEQMSPERVYNGENCQRVNHHSKFADNHNAGYFPRGKSLSVESRGSGFLN